MQNAECGLGNKKTKNVAGCALPVAGEKTGGRCEEKGKGVLIAQSSKLMADSS